MDDFEYLFPKALRVTPSGISRVLMIGSCQTAQIHSFLRHTHPDTQFDYVVSNYVGDLPKVGSAKRYDMAFIQFPLRSIITDHIVWFGRMTDRDFRQKMLDIAKETLAAMYDAAVEYAANFCDIIFISNFISPQREVSISLHEKNTKSDLREIVKEINSYLQVLISQKNKCILIDVDSISSVIGKRYILDDDVSFFGHNALKISSWSSLEPPGLAVQPIPSFSECYPSKEAIFAELLFQQMEQFFRIEHQVDQVKAVVFDLDNTLWRGQIAEHYRDDSGAWPSSETWPMGVWEAVHHLKARGILVSLCSKNDREFVETNWHRALSPAFLQLSDFVCPMINWALKAENIAEILARFNIRPKSVVFVDDNPVERAAVACQFPEIRMLGENPWVIRRTLLWSSETQVRALTSESRQREEMVRRQITRDSERVRLSRQDFLDRLGSQLRFMDDSAIADRRGRVLELINKTNQFNTTGRRWDAKTLADFTSSGGHVFAFEVLDRYADYGIVGVVLAAAEHIEQFVMSCRVMGMDLEIAALNYVVNALRRQNENASISAVLQSTADNMPCRTFFERGGFEASSDAGGSSQAFKLAVGRQPNSAPHVKISSPPQPGH